MVVQWPSLVQEKYSGVYTPMVNQPQRFQIIIKRMTNYDGVRTDQAV